MNYAFDTSKQFTHTIDGIGVGGEEFFSVYNPATGMAFASAPAGTAEHVGQAVDAAATAFTPWATLSHASRASLIVQFANAIDKERDTLAALLTTEQGKPLARARDEVGNAAKYLRELIKVPLDPEVMAASDGRRIELHHRPLGVVGAITPWNVPVLLAIWKIGHALITGNTIVLKPAPTTPLTTLRLGEIGRSIFPRGVLNVVVGGDAVGRTLTEHPKVSKVSFTGSVAVGRLVAATAASALKRCTLELGGNDAAIVLQDADVDTAAPAIFAAAFTNAGQACMAIKRTYVHQSIFQAFVNRMKACCDETVVGNGFDDRVRMGPVQNRRQFESITAVIEEARRAGAELHVGAQPVPSDGYFIAPHLAIAPDTSLRLVQEETFGPVLPIIPFESEGEAIAAANASPYGLSGSVWSSSFARAKAVAEQLEVGSAWINQHVLYDAHVPFGGMKCSGIGRENSIYGLRHYTEVQAVYCEAAG